MMVGGAVAHPAATTEPDMKPFDKLRAPPFDTVSERRTVRTMPSPFIL
jgi:hypothetical protein